MLLKVAVVLSLILVGFAVAIAGASRSWTGATRALDDELTESVGAGEAFTSDELPEPVARYAARAISPDAAPIAVARIGQEGSFQMGDGEDGWCPFVATEVMRVVEPGFYWDATIRMAPLLDVRVRDSYLPGRAGMVGKILGLVTVLDAADEPALRGGALSRYLAEAVWIPTRLVSGPGLTWTPVDERTADATLEDRGTTVTLRFTFDEDGDPIEVFGIRAREVDGTYVDTPWIGRFRDHAERGGYRIPIYGEVAWVIDGEERPYWRGTVTSVEFVAVSGIGSSDD